MTPRLLILQPSRLDPPGLLERWLTDAGTTLHVIAPATDELPGLDRFDGLVCLGGEMGAHDDAEHPWLADVRWLLATALTRMPVLGICLGAQLLAASTGGAVRRADRPDVGVGLVAKRDAAADDPLFGPLPLTPDVLQFHHDEIRRLPAEATLLASSPRHDNEAFRIGTSGYGLGFHIETTPQTVLSWAEHDPDAAAHGPARLDPERLELQHADLAETWAGVAERFVALCRGELAPARRAPGPGSRTRLPLAGQ